MRDFRRLAVFPKAHALSVFVHRIVRLLPRDERFGLAPQMRGAARSIASNLVEGCGRRTRDDFAHFIDVSTGSANELIYYALLCRDLDYLPIDVCDEIEARATEVIRMLVALARMVRQSPDFHDQPRTRSRNEPVKPVQHREPSNTRRTHRPDKQPRP